MFHLLSSIYTDLTTRPRFNAVFLGEQHSGKSSLLAVLKDRYVDKRPTLGISASEQAHPNSGSSSSSSLPPTLPLPKTRPTVGQNVLDIIAPSVPNVTDTRSFPSSKSRMHHMQIIWPPPPPPQALAAATTQSSRGWFKYRPSSSAKDALSSTSTARAAAFGANSSSGSTKSLIHIWDLGGEASLRSIWREYYSETDCIIYFWDVDAAGKGEERQKSWEILISVVKEKSLQGLPLLIVLSKVDRATSRGGDSGRRRAKSQDGGVASTLTSAVADDGAGQEEGGQGKDDVTHERGVLDLQVDSADVEDKPVTEEQVSRKSEDAFRREGATVFSDIQSTDDILRSLQAFIQSHIEAYVVARAQKVAESSSRRASVVTAGAAPESRSEEDGGRRHPSDGGRSAGPSEGDSPSQSGAEEEKSEGEEEKEKEEEEEEEEFNTTVDGSPVLFPNTSLIALSLVTGEGVEEVMRWLIGASVRAGT